MLGFEEKDNCRKPAVAGSFYPLYKEDLEKEIKKYISNANVEEDIFKDKDIIGIISPHAGYRYSGSVAAYGYKLLMNKHYDLVILLCPSHHYYLNSFILDNRDFFLTPLGKVKVNLDVVDYICRKFEKFECISEIQDEEHSLEVQLPFLQHVLGNNFSILPVLYGDESVNCMVSMAQILPEIFRNFSDMKILVVVSSDLSHYHSYEEAYHLDQRVAEIIEKKDFQLYVSNLYERKIEACGAGPIGTFVKYAQENNKQVKVLKLLNSGDTGGDKRHVVGYMSAVMY